MALVELLQRKNTSFKKLRQMRPEEFQEYKELTLEWEQLTKELFSDYDARVEERPGSRRRYLTEDAYADPRWQDYCKRWVAFYQRAMAELPKAISFSKRDVIRALPQ